MVHSKVKLRKPADSKKFYTNTPGVGFGEVRMLEVWHQRLYVDEVPKVIDYLQRWHAWAVQKETR